MRKLIFILFALPVFALKMQAQSLSLVSPPPSMDSTYDMLSNRSAGGTTVTEFNGNMYYYYRGEDGEYSLAEYNGTSITTIKKPSNYTIARNELVVYNSNLYTNVSGINTGLVKLVGDSLKPAVLSSTATGTFNLVDAYQFNNKLYGVFYTSAGTKILGEYDGTNITTYALPNLSDQLWGFFIEYNNKLHFRYRDLAGKFYLAYLNGSTITSIPNPDNGLGLEPFLNIYQNQAVANGNLYFEYHTAANKFTIGKYDGTSVSFLSYPNANVAYMRSPMVSYNNELYFSLVNLYNNFKLAKYDGTTISTFVNPDSSTTFGGVAPSQFIVHGSDLICSYDDVNANRSLIKCDGTSLTLIPNPDAGSGIFDAQGGNNAFIGPAKLNGNLYYAYKNVDNFFKILKFDGLSTSFITSPDTAKQFGFVAGCVAKNQLIAGYATKKYTIITMMPGPPGNPPTPFPVTLHLYNLYAGSACEPLTSIVTPANKSICIGSNDTTTVTYTGTGSTFQWYKNGAPLPLQTSKKLIISNYSSADAGTYYLKISSLCDVDSTNSFTISTGSAATPPSTTNQDFCVSTLVSDLSPAPSASIKWYNVATGGVALSAATSITASGNYYAEDNSGACPSSRALATITIHPLPAAPLVNSIMIYTGNKTLAQLGVPGPIVQFYDAAIAGNFLPASTPVVSGTTYYATQVVNGCESPIASFVANQIMTLDTVKACAPAFISSITTTALPGDNVTWFNTALGGAALIPSTALALGLDTLYVEEGRSGIDTLLEVPGDFAVNFNTITALTHDENDTLYFGTYKGNIYKSNPDGSDTVKIIAGTTQVNWVEYHKEGANRYLYYTLYAGSDIKKYNLATGVTTTIGSGFFGVRQINFDDANSRIFVADAENYKVKMINTLTNVITAIDSFPGVFPTSPLRPFGVYYHASLNTLFYTNLETGNIYAKDMSSPTNASVVIANVSQGYSISLLPNGKLLIASGSGFIYTMNTNGSGLTAIRGGLYNTVNPFYNSSNLLTYNTHTKVLRDLVVTSNRLPVIVIANPEPVITLTNDKVVCNNDTLPTISFSTSTTGGTTTYAWTNSVSSIGISATGSGDIASTTLTNAGNVALTAEFVVTPTLNNYGLACVGATDTFNVVVNPLGNVNAITDITACNNEAVASVIFGTSNIGGTSTYNWTNDNTSVGLIASGSGDIATFITTNSGLGESVGNIVVTPVYTYNGLACAGPIDSFKLTVAPAPTVVALANQSVCVGGTVAAVNFSTTNTGGTMSYDWTNNTPSIGLSSSGTGDIASFTANSTTTTVLTATVSVIPSYVINGKVCNGAADSLTILVSPNPTVNAVSANLTCYQNASGSIDVTASSATNASLSYDWGAGITTEDRNNLSAGTYSVTVMDALACSTYVSVTITEPSLLAATIASQNNVSCNGGSNATATISANGGTSPYAYSWTPSGGNTATASGLTAGTYTCTITDTNSCVTTQIVTITEPLVLAASIASQTNVSCNGTAAGSATITANGGTGTYTYSWLPSGGTSSTASSLTVGTYTCTITDANLCSATQVVTITEPSVLSSSIVSQTNLTCNGASTGSASITANGGTIPYTYSWSPNGGTAATASGLVAGTYTCTITDASLCTTTQTVTLTEPAAITTTISSQTDVACNGASNGSASVTAIGGGGSYTYSWSPVGGTSSSANGLMAGTYTCTITDANACTQTQLVSIVEPSAMVSSISSQTNVACNGASTGSATIAVTGGTGSYTYSWSPVVGSNNTINGLAAGVYTCTITDANLCATTQLVTISQNSVLSVSQTINICAGQSLTVGTNTYTATGTYVDVLLSSGGCDSTVTTNLIVNQSIDSTVSVIGNIATANQTGATYQWLDCSNSSSSIIGANSQQYTATATGDYAVQITLNGCTVKSSCVSLNADLVISNFVSPNNDGQSDFWKISPTETIKDYSVEVKDQWGTTVYYKENNYQNDWDGARNGKPIVDGVYYYFLSEQGKVKYSGSITILSN